MCNKDVNENIRGKTTGDKLKLKPVQYRLWTVTIQEVRNQNINGIATEKFLLLLIIFKKNRNQNKSYSTRNA